MFLHRFRSVFPWTLSLSAILVATQINAQPTSPEIQALFEQAIELMEKKQYAVACPKLEEVVKKLPTAVGARMELGRCYEGEERLASAWSQYSQAAPIARSGGDIQRATEADKKVAELEPQITKLRILVPPAIRSLKGLEVRLDDTVQSSATWGTPLPVDAKEHVITSTAPGFAIWERRVVTKDNPPGAANSAPLDVIVQAPKRLPTNLHFDISPEVSNLVGVVVKVDGNVVERAQLTKNNAVDPGSHDVEVSAPGHESYIVQLTVKVGEDAIVTIKPLKKLPVHSGGPSNTSTSSTRVAGFVLGGVGVVGAGIGGVLGGLAISENKESNKYCNAIDECNQTGYDLRNEARTLAFASTGLVIAGGVLAATGLTLIIVGSRGGSQNGPKTSFVVGPGSMQLRGTW